ncbi:exodeoxyribonuclease VII small subunit [Microaerobacter geothermalis]|uniref:exodeoxyribonuclease VII small subunit n=1 Tax=Microaerobacter geothermalis TaxID=674972 RepID=UPI001F3B8942|nr:exodeoxyribonuclease VII small subunit [Microaerobacter geothermalis]MCF6094440.1 exodeoxyribonuclease VII small subunit [Microaerobacter geothermalis]
MEKQTKMDEMSFEEALSRLEKVVESLEDGDVSLEVAIELFQEGMQLSKLCTKKLESVEQRIEMLIEKEGDMEKVPFRLEEEQD